MLRSLRFLGEPILVQCRQGTHRMMKPEEGPAVFKIQTALIDRGFPLPIFGVDGRFGDETAAAVSAYKSSKGLSPADGVVGPGTMGALDDDFAAELRPIAPWFVAPTTLSA